MDFQINTEWLSFAIYGSSFNLVLFSRFFHFPSFLESEWEGPIISQPEISTKWVASKEMGCKRNRQKKARSLFILPFILTAQNSHMESQPHNSFDAGQVPCWLWIHFETVDFLCTTNLWLRNWLSFFDCLLVGLSCHQKQDLQLKCLIRVPIEYKLTEKDQVFPHYIHTSVLDFNKQIYSFHLSWKRWSSVFCFPISESWI